MHKNRVIIVFVKILLVFLVILGFFPAVAAQNKLKQVHIIFRHGERTPTRSYPLDPYRNHSWPQGWAQLTNFGKLQMYKLGIRLREIYGDFIPEMYFPEDVSMRSSYADRCLVSAECLLAGLFPPKGFQVWNEELLWQPIPVHSTPRAQDKLVAMTAQCNKWQESLQEVMQSKELQKINEENADLYEFLTNNTGSEISNIRQLETLYYTLHLEQLQNVTLPSWTDNISINGTMRTLAARYIAAITETDFMKRVKGGVFLKEVIAKMKNSTKEKAFLYLYSGHDVSLVNILRTLGYYPRSFALIPGFGASISLDLYENGNVEVLYRQDYESEPVKIFVPTCSAQCNLSQFEESYKDLLPGNWEEECGNKI